MKENIFIRALELGYKKSSGISFDELVEKLKINFHDDDQKANFIIPDYIWQYGQGEFYDGMANGNITTAFLGSYHVKITTIQNADGTVTLTFTINNTSGWESATRLRIDNDNNGQHDEIIPNKPRATGIWLGGNFSQTWTWSDTLKNLI